MFPDSTGIAALQEYRVEYSFSMLEEIVSVTNDDDKNVLHSRTTSYIELATAVLKSLPISTHTMILESTPTTASATSGWLAQSLNEAHASSSKFYKPKTEAEWEKIEFNVKMGAKGMGVKQLKDKAARSIYKTVL